MLQGLANVFRKIGMIDDDNYHAIGRRLVITAMTIVRAGRGGLLHRKVELNREVAEGEVIATITDIFGEVVEQDRARMRGRSSNRAPSRLSLLESASCILACALSELIIISNMDEGLDENA